MAKKNTFMVNGHEYIRLTRTFGKKLNKNGELVPNQKQFVGKTKKEAQKKMDEYARQREAGLELLSETFGVVSDEWIENTFLKLESIKPRTKERYLNAWNNVIKPSELYGMPLNEVTHLVVQRTYNSTPFASSTIKAAHKLMRMFYKYLSSNGFSRNFTEGLAVPISAEKRSSMIEDEEITVWTDVELKKILEGFDLADSRFRLRFLIVLAYTTGLRISELLALKYSDITESGVRVTKQTYRVPPFERTPGMTSLIKIEKPKSSKSIRTVPVSPFVLDELKKHKDWHLHEMKENRYSSDYIFTSAKGNLLDYNAVLKSCQRYYKAIDVPLKPFHTFRHTFGTNLCRYGVPIEIACDLLGHSSIAITKAYYVHTSEDRKVDAIRTLTNNMPKPFAS